MIQRARLRGDVDAIYVRLAWVYTQVAWPPTILRSALYPFPALEQERLARPRMGLGAPLVPEATLGPAGFISVATLHTLGLSIFPRGLSSIFSSIAS